MANLVAQIMTLVDARLMFWCCGSLTVLLCIPKVLCYLLDICDLLMLMSLDHISCDVLVVVWF